MKIEDCDHFDHCSAPLCPLDTGLKQRSMLSGERICTYVTQYSKGKAAKDDLRHRLPLELSEAIAEHYFYISTHNAGIRYELKRASTKPTKGANLHKEKPPESNPSGL